MKRVFLIVGSCVAILATLSACEPKARSPISGESLTPAQMKAELDNYVLEKQSARDEEIAAKQAEIQKRRKAMELAIAKVESEAQLKLAEFRSEFEGYAADVDLAITKIASSAKRDVDAMSTKVDRTIQNAMAAFERQMAILDVGKSLLSESGIPLLMAVGTGIGWMRSHGKAKEAEANGKFMAAEAADKAHDDAWEESKKETLASISMALAAQFPALRYVPPTPPPPAAKESEAA